MSWQKGKQLQGDKYTIERVLGQGRFGITYLARDRKGNRVAIKTLNDAALRRPDRQDIEETFNREASELYKCEHPSIVRLKEQPFLQKGLLQKDQRCFAMEYVFGVDLTERDCQVLPQVEALRYVRQVGEALAAIHKRKVYHRDVRPGNIRIRAGKPEAVLIDFGLARSEGDETEKTEKVVSGFAPPELYFKGGPRGPFVDVYSLGATLYELLTGMVPPDALERKLRGAQLQWPSEFDAGLREAIEWAMQLETKDRPQTMQSWLAKLPKPRERQWPQPRRFRLPEGWTGQGVGTVLAALVAMAALGWQVWREWPRDVGGSSEVQTQQQDAP